MADDPTHADLLSIYSRLGAIEGKVSLVARAERDSLIEVLRSTVKEKPIIGQIYLLVDGKRSQKDIIEALGADEIKITQGTVSKRMSEMVSEHGMIAIVSDGAQTVYAKEPETQKLLNLTRKVREWLLADGQIVPATRAKKPRKG
jgi:exopolysaccharide biosynthesis protein